MEYQNPVSLFGWGLRSAARMTDLGPQLLRTIENSAKWRIVTRTSEVELRGELVVYFQNLLCP